MIDTIEPGEPAAIEVPFQLRRRGVEIRLVLRAEGAEAPDDKLVALVARSTPSCSRMAGFTTSRTNPSSSSSLNFMAMKP